MRRIVHAMVSVSLRRSYWLGSWPSMPGITLPISSTTGAGTQ